jgi:hypothetical protein
MSEANEWVLTATDRCDAGNCGAQGYVQTIGVSGELLFCNHHYEDIINTETGYDTMMKFAYQIIDERDKLIENRLIGAAR